MKKLDATSLTHLCDADIFDFETTEDITVTQTTIGQQRMETAVKMGLNLYKEGYNIFALGPAKANKQHHIKELLKQKAEQDPVPPDICYVNNFKDAYSPHALLLPSGRASELQKKMEELLEDLIPTLTVSFEAEEYQNKKQEISQVVQHEQDKSFEELQKKAEEKELTLVRTPSGFSFVPAKEGEKMSDEELKELSEEKRKELDEATKELQQELQKIIQKIPSYKRKTRERLKELDRIVATQAIEDLFAGLSEQFSDLEEVRQFIDSVEQDIVKNVQSIMRAELQGQPQPKPDSGEASPDSTGTVGAAEENPFLDRYKVNVLVDHSASRGAPVVYENNPNYKNLLGRVEYRSRMGALTTSFNLIKAGALHKANGGYLVLDARRVLLEPYAWESLKRTLMSGDIKIESLRESQSLISTVSLEPEPVELKVKVVLIGARNLYYTLSAFDPDFSSLFKIQADFEDEIDRNHKNQQLYAHLITGLIRKNDLRHFEKHAVARVIEQSARIVADCKKLTTRTEQISDLLTEAHYWAEQNNHDVVKREDVQQAIDQYKYRAGRLLEKVQESINRDKIFIDTTGEKTGQVNGLSVIQFGNLTFGRPTRITARIQMGKGDIVNIEREVKMSGPIHSKGVLILKGYLGEKYAIHQPLALSASLVFEQSYSTIDGDSASSAELYVLLSAIGNIPLKQSISVTGSVNQHGKIQPIGGVNEKVEGFFDICKKRGFTQENGVIIPQSNVDNLMLKQEVIKAIKAGSFHLWAVETIGEGMELLTGLDMGKPDDEGKYPKQSVNGKVMHQLQHLAKKRKTFSTARNET